MKIGIIGAGGKSGNLIMREAVQRGHAVTAIVRNSSRIADNDVNILEKDILSIEAEDVKDFDVVVNAFNPPSGSEHLHVEAARVLIEALKGAPNTRLIVVGGAGSLFTNEERTQKLFDTESFPEEYLPTAKSAGEALMEFQSTNSIKWTYISPAVFFDPQGKTTGSYKVGKDYVIYNSKGESYISYADYVLALLDEIENPKHINERFTVVAERE